MTIELIASGLRFGGFIRIADQAVADRYNQCLQKWGLKAVATVPFHVDGCGFSLEVANQLQDLSYLNPHGVGRRFIIVSPSQANAPVVDASFSWTKEFMAGFYQANSAVIARLTLRDTIYGQMSDVPLAVDDIDDIARITSVTFDVQTINGSSAKATELAHLVSNYKADRALWTNVSAMEKIVALARDVGDVRQAATHFEATTYVLPRDYHTSVLGGISRIGDMIVGDANALEGRNRAGYALIDASSPGQLLGHFHGKQIVEGFNPTWLTQSGLLAHRLHCLVCELLPDDFLGDATQLLREDYAEALIQNYRGHLVADPRFEGLSRLRKTITFGTGQEVDAVERSLNARLRLSLRRARVDQGAKAQINRIMSSFAPYDPVTLFMTDKEAFYLEFEKRTDVKKAFWIEAVKSLYLADKEKLRKRFFGEIAQAS